MLKNQINFVIQTNICRKNKRHLKSSYSKTDDGILLTIEKQYGYIDVI